MKITVITAIFNRAETIGQALDSVARQCHDDLEHLIADGASTDGTIDQIRANPPGMRLISEPDNGIYDATNKGIAAATGDVVGPMHNDDFFASDMVIKKVCQAFETTGANAVYGDLEYVSAEDPNKSSSTRDRRSGPAASSRPVGCHRTRRSTCAARSSNGSASTIPAIEAPRTIMRFCVGGQ